MKVDTFACDICGVQKKDTNHWFLGNTYKNGYGVLAVNVMHWAGDAARTEGNVHLCGTECATKFVARELAK